MQGKTAFLGNLGLALFNFRVVKFFHLPALQAYQMIMVAAAFELKHRLAAFKMVTLQQARLLELCQYPVNGGDAGIFAFADQGLVNIFRRQMPYRTFLEQVEDSQPWQRGLEADGFEVVWFTHVVSGH